MIDDLPLTNSLSGHEWQDSLSHEILDPKTERELMLQAQAGDKDAVDKIFRHNQRLVYSIASRYFFSGIGGDQTIEDLMQWGNIGLLKAVRKWDPKRNLKFSTYATYWIKAIVRRYGSVRGNPFGMTIEQSEKMSTVRTHRSRLTNQLCREPSIQELAKSTGYNEEFINFSLNVSNKVASLNAPALNEEDEIIEILNLESDCPDEDAFIDAAGLLKAIQELPENERYILCSHYGLAGLKQSTCQEIGLRYGVSRTRIQQIEERAIRRLRICLKARYLS